MDGILDKLDFGKQINSANPIYWDKWLESFEECLCDCLNRIGLISELNNLDEEMMKILECDCTSLNHLHRSLIKAIEFHTQKGDPRILRHLEMLLVSTGEDIDMANKRVYETFKEYRRAS